MHIIASKRASLLVSFIHVFRYILLSLRLKRLLSLLLSLLYFTGLCLTHFVWNKAEFFNKAKGAFDSFLVSFDVILI